MEDLTYLAITIVFFLISLGYIRFCGALREVRKKDEQNRFLREVKGVSVQVIPIDNESDQALIW